jgi:hypothetical protein
MTLDGFSPGSYSFSCDFGSGGDTTYSLAVSRSPETFDNGATCYDAYSGDTVWVMIQSFSSNVLKVGGSAPPPKTYAETTGGLAHTWTDYADAGGTEGPSIPAFDTVQIACRVTGFAVADGNTWWYRVASGPWNSGFYVSADAFYNNGSTSGPLTGTPFVDPNVPVC